MSILLHGTVASGVIARITQTDLAGNESRKEYRGTFSVGIGSGTMLIEHIDEATGELSEAPVDPDQDDNQG